MIKFSIVYQAMNCTDMGSGDCSFSLESVAGRWHYLAVTVLEPLPVEFAISVVL